MWKPAIDDYLLSLAYLVISDLDTTRPSDHLADKINARTRRRHERQIRVHQPTPYVPSRLSAVGPTSDDTERRAIARIELAQVADAVRHGVITPNGWQTILSTRFDWQPGVPTNSRQRHVVARAQQRLATWRAEAA
jgi:hypothetical protein